MSNVREIKPRVSTIKLNDGKEYTLLYTLNALAELEDRYGSPDAAFEAMNKGSIKAIRCVLWCGLLEHHPELTERQVGSLIDTNTLSELSTTVEAAMASDMPDEVTATATTAALPNA